MSNDVVSETAAWYARIAAARAAGIELEELSDALSRVVGANYFGIGCEEGLVLFTRLRAVVEHGTKQLKGLAATAERLAISATDCQRGLQQSDAENGTSIQSPPR
ncbi:hypothetical protein [Gordonia sp. (in: high G+C Gram-positive bacteria)]|uniref:hypothetical protein n=1 Tax=Gordonia sp. (in: high G+C Gram-positive bacteria) TaxID=84139 RepID=UPI003F9845C1